MPKNVFILGPDQESYDLRVLKENVPDATFIGDGQGPIPFDDFHRLINADRIYIVAHGSFEGKEHFVSISDNQKFHTQSLLKHIFKMVQTPSREKPVEIVLASCYGAVAADALEVPQNAVVAIMAGDHPSSIHHGIANMIESTKVASLWDYFAKSILSYPDDKTLIAKGFRYTAKAPDEVLDNQELTAFLMQDVNNYLHMATRYNAQMQSSIMPITTEEVASYRAQLCFSFPGPSYLQTYLEAGYSPDVITPLGSSLLYSITAMQGLAPQATPASLQLLLDSGATVDYRNPLGWTALKVAARYGLTDAAIILLNAGAEVNLQDNNGNSPLCEAAFAGRAETMSALLDRGANISLPNNYGVTPLVGAIFSGNSESVRVCLDHNADPASKSWDNIPLSKRARDLQHNEIADLLEKRIAAQQSIFTSILSPMDQGTILPEARPLAAATEGKLNDTSSWSMAGGIVAGAVLGNLLGKLPNKKMAAVTTVATGALLGAVGVVELAPLALTLVIAGATAYGSHVMQQNLRRQQGGGRGI